MYNPDGMFPAQIPIRLKAPFLPFPAARPQTPLRYEIVFMRVLVLRNYYLHHVTDSNAARVDDNETRELTWLVIHGVHESNAKIRDIE